jgi:hypothetical protein
MKKMLIVTTAVTVLAAGLRRLHTRTTARTTTGLTKPAISS